MSENITAKKKRKVESHPKQIPEERRFCSTAFSKYILHWLEGIPTTRRMTRLAQQQENPNAMLPPPPVDIDVTSNVGASRPPTGAIMRTATGATGGSKTDQLVSKATYRTQNLIRNKIMFRFQGMAKEPRPEHVLRLCTEIERSQGRPLQPPTMDTVAEVSKTMVKHQDKGVLEDYLSTFAITTMFPTQRQLERTGTALHCPGKCQYHVSAVPGGTRPNDSRVSRPWPDMSYGYEIEDGPFSARQMEEAIAMSPSQGAVSKSLCFPFLVVELKGTGGSMAIALNQCLGGAATCVNTVRGLNRLAGVYRVEHVDSTAFSITMNEHVAIVYVMWEDGESFIQERVCDFMLSREQDITSFWEVLMNILTWGYKVRLPAIQAALDKIAEVRLGKENEIKKREDPSKEESDSKRVKSHA